MKLWFYRSVSLLTSGIGIYALLGKFSTYSNGVLTALSVYNIILLICSLLALICIVLSLIAISNSDKEQLSSIEGYDKLKDAMNTVNKPINLIINVMFIILYFGIGITGYVLGFIFYPTTVVLLCINVIILNAIFKCIYNTIKEAEGE